MYNSKTEPIVYIYLSIYNICICIMLSWKQCAQLVITTLTTCGNSCTWADDALALLVEHSLVHWYLQCVTAHHVPKCMSYHKATVVITGRAHCVHGGMFITLVFLLWDLSTLCVVKTSEHYILYMCYGIPYSVKFDLLKCRALF